MKADYQNWMPKWMIFAFLGGAVLAGALSVLISIDLIRIEGTAKTVLRFYC